jgi:LDH2 family malate/lactate/ureidoglycolate dehydrogenase
MAEAWDEGTRVDVHELLELVTGVFRRCGMEDKDAHLLADSLVFADLSGIYSHGVLRVLEYVQEDDGRRRRPQGAARGRARDGGLFGG